MSIRIRCLRAHFLILSIVVAALWLPAESASRLRKRVANDSENNEFGRVLSLFSDRQNDEDHRLSKIVKRRTSSHHIVDINHKKEIDDLEKEWENSGFVERMLQFSMSNSMSMVTAAPTPAVSIVSTPAPSYLSTPGPTVPSTSSPTAIYASPTLPPTVYVMPTISPTETPTQDPTEGSVRNTATYAPTLPPTPPPTELPYTSAPTYAPTLPPTPAPTEVPYASAATYAPTLPPTPPPTEDPYANAAPPIASTPITESASTEVRVLSLQEQQGVCSGPSNGVGCASESDGMQGGNPNDIVNCFDVGNAGLLTPVQLTAVRFWVGDSTLPPADMSIQVWEGTVATGPTTHLHSEDLVGYVQGENNVALSTTLLVFSQQFCVGVKSASMTDGLRVQTDGGQPDHASYIMSPRCGLPTFKSLGEIAAPGDFCIEAMVAQGSA